MEKRATGVVQAKLARAPGQWKLLVLGAAAAVAAVAGAATGSPRPVKMFPLDDVVLEREQFMGSMLRTEGTLVRGTLLELKRPLAYRFTLASKGVELSVRYDGFLPDDFREAPDDFREAPGCDLPVAVEGELREDGSFEATHVFPLAALGSNRPRGRGPKRCWGG